MCLQVGADEKLANVIDGESLVNDGSALVIFLVLQQFVQGATLSAGQVRCGGPDMLTSWQDAGQCNENCACSEAPCGGTAAA